MKILIVEDEVSMARAIVRILEKNNCCAEAVYNGNDAVNYMMGGDYDAVILDVMLPDMDGIDVLKKVGEKGIFIPIIMLTAKAEVEDKVLGLDIGANDYLTKPFDAKELLARIRALTRSQGSSDSTLSFGNIKLDRGACCLMSPGGNFTLTNKEFQIMEILMSNPTRIVSTERLLEKVWGYDVEVEINIVWVYISYLRKKLTSLHANVQIKSNRNLGYSLEELSCLTE